MNLNKAFLIGRLTSDPQLRTTSGGQAVTTLGLATNRVWVDRTGARKEDTQFHSVVVWGRQAEVAHQFLRRGSLVFIEGRLQTRSWQDAQGQNRKTTEVVCERMQLGPRPSGGENRESNQSEPREPQPTEEKTEELPAINVDEEVKPEDIPF